jgi:hypothetical protein
VSVLLPKCWRLKFSKVVIVSLGLLQLIDAFLFPNISSAPHRQKAGALFPNEQPEVAETIMTRLKSPRWSED